MTPSDDSTHHDCDGKEKRDDKKYDLVMSYADWKNQGIENLKLDQPQRRRSKESKPERKIA